MCRVPAEPVCGAARSQGGEKPSLPLGEATTSAGQEASCGVCCMVSALEGDKEEWESLHRDVRNVQKPLTRSNSVG